MKNIMFRNLRAELARFNMTLQDLSESMGIPVNSLRGKLSGRTTLYFGDVAKICKAFPMLFESSYLFAELYEQVEKERAVNG